MRTAYIVKRGEGENVVTSLISGDKSYAAGYCAGLNHTGRKYWFRVEEVEAFHAGTRVRYWKGAKEGVGEEGVIRGGITGIGGTPCQFIEGVSGGISLAHIELLV